MRKIFKRTLVDHVGGGATGCVIEVSVGLSTAVLAVSIRYLLVRYAGHAAPFAPISLGVMLCCMIAGWRSAVLSLFTGVLLAVTLIAEPLDPTALYPISGPASIFLVSQLFVIWIMTRYQQEAATGAKEALIAYKEIEHRTKNNYQIILSMAYMQAQKSRADVRNALEFFITRITALSLVTDALHGNQLDTLTLGDHLCKMTAALEQSLAPPNVDIDCDVEDIPIKLKSATPISLIVNEIVTNAIKHAFPNGYGCIKVRGKIIDSTIFEICISDNGIGMDLNALSNGLGKKLISSFAKQLKAKLDIESSSKGTLYRLSIPMSVMGV